MLHARMGRGPPWNRLHTQAGSEYAEYRKSLGSNSSRSKQRASVPRNLLSQHQILFPERYLIGHVIVQQVLYELQAVLDDDATGDAFLIVNNAKETLQSVIKGDN